MDNYTGKRLDGRYEIQEVIGVGGMAVVYKAYDNIDDRIVAVKILKDEFLANEEFRRRFKNESKAIAVLSHPNIVKVFDVSYGDRLQYIVMEYVEGITLKEYIEQQGRINWRETIHFMMQILRALQHAHDKGVVHRDVKPQNIMLLQNGNIKVADFGIARFSRSDTRTMTDSAAIGSVHYISPEQARGELTDDKADIYSVGVVLYEMLTGRVPFQSANSVSVALMQLQNDPVMPRKLNENIPVGLEQITMHAMQKLAKDRFQSAAEMLLDLEEVKRNASITFDYSFFVDKTPTKFVSNSAPVPPVAPPAQSAAFSQEAEPNAGDEAFDEALESDIVKTKTVPILIGITGALLVLLAVILGILYFTSDKDNNQLEVPSFLNKNYADVIADKAYEDFEFEEVPVTRTQQAIGIIVEQNPTAGQMVEKNTKIQLFVVRNTGNATTKVTVPSVVNESESVARIKLTELGLVVKSYPRAGTGKSLNTVVATDPPAGTELNNGDEIIVYYASEEGMQTVPKLIGWPLEDARHSLEEEKLVLGNVKYENSKERKGMVIDQSVQEGAKVIPSTKVDVVVSNGIPPESTVTIRVTLPAQNADGEMAVYLNGAVYGNKKTVFCDGREMALEPITGSGADNNLVVRVNGMQIFACKVDFTKDPAVTSEVSNNHVEPTSPIVVLRKEYIPNLMGKTRSESENALRSFTNVQFLNREVTDPTQVSIVLEQSIYSATLLNRYALDTPIVLYIGVLGEYPEPSSTEPDSTADPNVAP